MAATTNPRTLKFWLDYGNLCVAQGQPSLAVEQFQKAIRLEPLDLAANLDFAKALVASGKPGEAAKILKQMLKLHHDQPQIQELLKQLPR